MLKVIVVECGGVVEGRLALDVVRSRPPIPYRLKIISGQYLPRYAITEVTKTTINPSS